METQDLNLSGTSAIVLLSGGMDSATALALAIKTHGKKNVTSVSFFYGQKHKAELVQAKAINDFYGIPHRQITLDPSVFIGGGSTLIDADKEVGNTTYREMISTQGMSDTYVPYRNGVILSFSAALAYSIGASYLYYGAHAEDARNFAYPDCTNEFNGAQASAIYVGSGFKVHLVTPFQWMTKGEVVEKGFELGVPFELTLSCYRGTRPACGKCPTCIERLEAFHFAARKDPIDYEGQAEVISYVF